jgi:hypothetical protein
MGKKLKTKLIFEFDTQELEEEVPELNFDVNMKTNQKNKRINIIEVKKHKKIRQDVSTRLF